jgi:cobalamin transport system substrate-binding protein
VSLSPSTTEALFAVGAGDFVVGRSEHCDHPAAARSLPSVGGFATPNLERVLALRPTVVVGSQSPAGPALEETLRTHGVDTLFPATRSVAEIIAMMNILGARFGASDGAVRATRRLEGQLASVERWAASRPHPTVVMVFDPRPLFVAGPGSFADELITLAGGKNAIVSGGQWPTIDEERLLALDPEVIVDASMIAGDSRLPSAPGWSTLRAVKNGTVRPLSSDAALRPGPRIGEGVIALARAIHGETPT